MAVIDFAWTGASIGGYKFCYNLGEKFRSVFKSSTNDRITKKKKKLD